MYVMVWQQRRYDRKRVTAHTYQFASIDSVYKSWKPKPFAFKLSAEVLEDFVQFYLNVMWYFPRGDPFVFALQQVADIQAGKQR